MTTTSWQPITELLQKEHTTLQGIIKKLQQLQKADAWLKIHLDKALASRCRVANLRDNCLVLITENASISTQILLQMPELIVLCQKNLDLQHIKTIQCKIRIPSPTAHHTQNTKPLREMTLSSAAAKCITETAKSILDPKLRSIMEKIAQQAGKREK